MLVVQGGTAAIDFVANSEFVNSYNQKATTCYNQQYCKNKYLGKKHLRGTDSEGAAGGYVSWCSQRVKP
jgi:hypothetical protein